MDTTHTMQYYREQEQLVFSSIPGMKELLQAEPDKTEALAIRYPDAFFALQVANNLFNHNRELSIITQRAYFSILNQENISDVRYRYNKEMDSYWKRHMWDD